MARDPSVPRFSTVPARYALTARGYNCEVARAASVSAGTTEPLGLGRMLGIRQPHEGTQPATSRWSRLRGLGSRWCRVSALGGGDLGRG